MLNQNLFLKSVTTKDTVTQNGAMAHSTSQHPVLDYFAKAGNYRGRSETEVRADMANMFAAYPELALKSVFYNRTVTRKTDLGTQQGQGARDEFIRSLQWLAANRPDTLNKNLWLVPIIGRWSDLWYDSPSTGLYFYPSTDKVYELLKKEIEGNTPNAALIAKYLPKIRSTKNTKNDRHRRLNYFARGFCRFMGWSEKEYRQFKSSEEHTAHDFQRKMCAQQWSQLDFKTIPGKALFNMISRKGKDGKNPLARHGIEGKYMEWLEKQPTAKFTGYPFELYKAASSKRDHLKTVTYNKQFQELLNKAREAADGNIFEKGVLCALDTSGSMESWGWHGLGDKAPKNFRPIDVCVGLGIYFSSLMSGHFKDNVVMFNNYSRFLKLNGTFCDKVDQIGRQATAWGSTNFQSVIDEIVRVRIANPEIPVSDYPKVLLVVSDMQFNPSGGSKATNHEMAMAKLKAVGLPEMTVIWWSICDGKKNTVFQSQQDDQGTVLVSGFDGSVITSILGGEEGIVDEKTGEVRKMTPLEQMTKALDQPALNALVV